MDSLYTNELTELYNKLAKNKEKNLLTCVALSAALRESDRLALARQALIQIRNLPCLDGTTQLRCWQPECPRCIALVVLEKLADMA